MSSSFVTPWTIHSPPGSSVHGIFRHEHCSGVPCPPPGGLPDPGVEPVSLSLAGTFFTLSPIGASMFCAKERRGKTVTENKNRSKRSLGGFSGRHNHFTPGPWQETEGERRNRKGREVGLLPGQVRGPSKFPIVPTGPGALELGVLVFQENGLEVRASYF